MGTGGMEYGVGLSSERSWISDVEKVVAALFGLFAVRTAVIVSVENVLAGVKPVFPDAAGDIFSPVEGYPTTPYVVGRPGA